MTLMRYAHDQFGQYAQVSVTTVSTRSVSVTADRGRAGQQAREVWIGWVHLAAPASVAQVGTAGGQGTVTVRIEGTQLGQPAERGSFSDPSLMDYSVPLTAGWHQIEIADDIPGNSFSNR